MVRDIKEIENHLNKLEEQAQAIGEKLEKTYQEYTEELGTTLQQQLLFSVYQICTQEYPQGFLRLKSSQQKALQKQVRELGEQAKEHLNLGGEVLQKLESEEEGSAEVDYILSEEWESLDQGEESTENESRTNLLKDLLNAREATDDSETQDTNPENLIAWSSLQEEAIALVLENVSSQANELLREIGVIPQYFPKEMIDAALQSEGAGSISNRCPGVLHLMLEVERKNQEQKTNKEDNEVMQLTLVRLRVGELEFAAPNLNRKRRELREFDKQIKQLQEQYNKVKRERAIAQAELAWRSSWQEDQA
jgi:hypothetical protein